MQRDIFDIDKLKQQTKGCFFCERTIDPEAICYEDKQFIAFLDSYPPTKGYCLVAPKTHYHDLTEVGEHEYQQFQQLVHAIAQAVKKAFNPHKICLVSSGGIESHFHFHVIPMYVTDVYNHFIDVLLKKEILNYTKSEKEDLVRQIKKYL